MRCIEISNGCRGPITFQLLYFIPGFLTKQIQPGFKILRRWSFLLILGHHSFNQLKLVYINHHGP